MHLFLIISALSPAAEYPRSGARLPRGLHALLAAYGIVRLLSRLEQTDRQSLEAANEVRVGVLRLAGQLDAVDPRQQLLEHDAHLQLRDVHTHAGVRAGTEGDVPHRALDVEHVGIFENLLVAAARRVEQHPPVTGSDAAAPEPPARAPASDAV